MTDGVLALMFVTGYGLLREGIGTNTLLQTITDESMRARVMSYYSMAMEGLAPFGSLLAGALADKMGTPRAVMVSGGACILGALWFWARLGRVRVTLRPIFEEKGILPRL